MKRRLYLHGFLLLVLLIIVAGCGKKPAKSGSTSGKSYADVTPEVGAVYSVKGDDLGSGLTADGDIGKPVAVYALMKVLEVNESQQVFYRLFSNGFAERPTSLDASVDLSGEQIEGLGTRLPTAASGAKSVNAFRNYEPELLRKGRLSEYDRGVVEELKDMLSR